ncbi:hypothetical protein HD597_012343 [Nonomuraea thailandensis]|uniref:Uncharacterized protein n=1 Tax=Nonomuraea thailandensis TaxID=1188745 RepID=A0A9X2H3K3_9ACTN|nr:hypothetical protein [Nonomuraea thailandensis]MCP2365323.1 hypothetical protein [Nonomuraea thailandensis]
MPLGLWVYAVMSPQVLSVLIGIGVLGCTVMVWRRVKVPGNASVLVGAGLVSGALSASTGTSVLSLVGFAVAGQVNSQSIWIGLVGLPVVRSGWFAGNAVFSRINPDRFRNVVLVALLVSAVVTLSSALSS